MNRPEIAPDEGSGILKLTQATRSEKSTFRKLLSTQLLVRLSVLSAMISSTGDTAPESNGTVNVAILDFTPKEHRKYLYETMGQSILDADSKNISENSASNESKYTAGRKYITKQFNEYKACQDIEDDAKAIECFKALKAKNKNFWN